MGFHSTFTLNGVSWGQAQHEDHVRGSYLAWMITKKARRCQDVGVLNDLHLKVGKN